MKMENEDDNPNPSRASGIRRTRSQSSSPQWSAQHVLILVNEVAAIEADCSNALSTFQKWKIIVENCNALGVPHSSNHCRRKWNLLLQDCKKIKRWESLSLSGRRHSYWSLSAQERKECKLPENFDNDLFNAINDVMGLLEDKPGSDHDSDPEAQDDALDMIADLGPRKQKRKSMPSRSHAEVKSQKRSAVEKPKKIHVVEQPHESSVVEKVQGREVKEATWNTEAEDNPENSCMDKKQISSREEELQMMVARLGENAEQIQAVVEQNLKENADLKNVEDLPTDFIRRQADKLIAYLGDIFSTLNQFSELVQENDE